MRPYSDINVGDIYESPLKWTGSDITYSVVSKTDGLVELRSSYQHPTLSETIWKKPTNRIFINRIYNGKTNKNL